MNTEMGWGRWLYAGECLVVPILWGLLIVAVTGRIEKLFGGRRRKRGGGDSESGYDAPISPEYHI